MSNQIRLTINITQELKDLVAEWSKEDDRSISSVIRQLLEKEAKCREKRKQESQSGFEDL